MPVRAVCKPHSLDLKRGALATDARGCSLWRSLLERPPPAPESRVRDPLSELVRTRVGGVTYIYIYIYIMFSIIILVQSLASKVFFFFRMKIKLSMSFRLKIQSELLLVFSEIWLALPSVTWSAATANTLNVYCAPGIRLFILMEVFSAITFLSSYSTR